MLSHVVVHCDLNKGRTLFLLQASNMTLEFGKVIPRPDSKEPQVSIYINEAVDNWGATTEV
jgi:hypothetical protein